MPKEIKAIKDSILSLSECNTTSVRDLVLHFQTLLSARTSRVFIEAPGLYFPDLSLYVISKAGLTRGHASLYSMVKPILPDRNRPSCYAFVLYPGSMIRTCLDSTLRKTAKPIACDLRVSMENVFNRKYHDISLVGSEIEQQLIVLFKDEF